MPEPRCGDRLPVEAKGEPLQETSVIEDRQNVDLAVVEIAHKLIKSTATIGQKAVESLLDLHGYRRAPGARHECKGASRRCAPMNAAHIRICQMRAGGLDQIKLDLESPD